MRLYLAAALFTSAERAYNALLAQCLRELDHEVFLPQEHQPATAEEIYRSDVGGIIRSEVVVALCEGADPDSGTAWEMGFAMGLTMPVILCRTDWRVSGEHGTEVVNLMLTQSARAVLHMPGVAAWELAREIDREIRSWEQQ